MTENRKYLSDEDVRKNEVQWYRESILSGLDRNIEYLLCDEVGRKLSTSAFMTLPDAWLRVQQRAKEYSTDYSAMAWFAQYTMSPNTQAISASILAGLPDHAAALLRETLEAEQLSLALDVKPDYTKETTGKKLRLLEKTYADFDLRRSLLSYSKSVLGNEIVRRVKEFQNVVSSYGHASGRLSRAFSSGSLSDHFPAPPEDFYGGKTLMKDYVPESWIFNKIELEELEQEMKSVTRLIDLITAYCDLAGEIFDVWLGLIGNESNSRH